MCRLVFIGFVFAKALIHSIHMLSARATNLMITNDGDNDDYGW